MSKLVKILSLLVCIGFIILGILNVMRGSGGDYVLIIAGVVGFVAVVLRVGNTPSIIGALVSVAYVSIGIQLMVWDELVLARHSLYFWVFIGSVSFLILLFQLLYGTKAVSSQSRHGSGNVEDDGLTSEVQLLSQERVDLGGIDHNREAESAAKGRLRSRGYQKERQRETKNIEAVTEVVKVETEGDRATTERIRARKELFKEAGLYKDLPEKEQKEVVLEDMELDTEIMRQKKEQAVLVKEIGELKKEVVIPAPVEPEEEQQEVSEEERFEQEIISMIGKEGRISNALRRIEEAEQTELATVDPERQRTTYMQIRNRYAQLREKVMEM